MSCGGGAAKGDGGGGGRAWEGPKDRVLRALLRDERDGGDGREGTDTARDDDEEEDDACSPL